MQAIIMASKVKQRAMIAQIFIIVDCDNKEGKNDFFFQHIKFLTYEV